MNDFDISHLGFAPGHLNGQVAIVTGASSGIGRYFAGVLAAAGADVVVAARRADRLAELAGDHVLPVSCDVGIAADRQRLVEEAIGWRGRVDILVNNAATGVASRAEDESDEAFGHTLDINVNALFSLTTTVARHMLERGSGAIVNIASIFGLVASAPMVQASYCASKGAVVNLTRELGAQWARRGVRVNAIAPGWFPTEMTTDAFSDDGSMSYIRRNTPIGRTGELHELAGALLLLAGPAGTYIVGQTVAVDGGWTTR